MQIRTQELLQNRFLKQVVHFFHIIPLKRMPRVNRSSTCTSPQVMEKTSSGPVGPEARHNLQEDVVREKLPSGSDRKALGDRVKSKTQ